MDLMSHMDEKRRDYYKAYYQANKEKSAAAGKKYREENKEYIAAQSRVWYQKNKRKIAENSITYREENKERIQAYKRSKHGKETARNATLKRRYGITLADHNSMFETQGRKCKICAVVSPGAWNVDHCHTTGKVRGILCVKCNTSLGKIEKDPALYQRMLDHIEENKI